MKPALSEQKLRGSYYTPKIIADFLAQWAIHSATALVLEPSCGDGEILESVLRTLVENGASAKEAVRLAQGVEINCIEAKKALDRIRAAGFKPTTDSVVCGDFFDFCKKHIAPTQQTLSYSDEPAAEQKLFDAVVGNPPFVRYQNFPEEQRIAAFEIMHQVGMKPSRLTNSWVGFIVASSLLLKENGRLAMVIPAELLQVNYAAQLRYFLSEFFAKITLITFKKLVFAGIQQEVVLVLAEKSKHERTGIRTIELDEINDLVAYTHTEFDDSELKLMCHSTEKWTQYFLTNEEIQLLRQLKENEKLTLASKVIDVDVGVVTGLNEFFVLSEEKIKELSLESYTQRIVGRSAHLKGICFSDSDWQSNVEKNYAAHLLDLPNVAFDELPQQAKDYVSKGETAGLNAGYKCRIRNRWYIVPSVWTPDAFMLRQVHSYPKIIVNSADATCTDTIHRIKLLNGVGKETVAAAFLNSLTFAFAEVTGRSYGGGVLELEPNEAERLPIPLLGSEKLDFQEIHRLLLDDKIEAVLDITDKILLVDSLGLSTQEAKMLRGIWLKLRDRRINRKHSKKSK